ncbi:transcription factor MBP1 Ecym_2783 [Eremothecium cymbalariae DBVPG|uniref:Transcription factor MBP1 n=1 Tax=Eremothecium cymbalariae (strain CBS 270.75 / DBVPG 7215 / KCTC 17166 / NRRL Y-17582) TaxID=931890 RepID=G8JQ18_ERECY|nr:Hypothetical protein Ecym_2783 [Eremothecium cymbalariae DBVPG\
MSSTSVASRDQIYSAKYSGVEVYEFIHPTGSIMKRKADDWVNATHILKAAKFAKAKRTRILEKEVIKDIHEKVQGGFGKYQGTWVPLDIARRLAEKFDVLEELRPLFDFSQRDGSASPPQAPKHHHASRSDSTKKGTGKSPSGALNNASGSVIPKRRGRPPRSKKLDRIPASGDAALQRSRSDVTGFHKPSITISTISSHNLPSIQSTLQRGVNIDEQQHYQDKLQQQISQQKYEELDIEDGLSSDIETNLAYIAEGPVGSNRLNTQLMTGKEEPVSSSSSLPSSPSDFSAPVPFDTQRVGSATSPIGAMLPRYSMQSRPPTSDLDQKVNDYLAKLVDYFINSEMQNTNAVPIELLNPPHSTPYIDAWIDSEHHTAFHWACAMGNLPIVEALLQAGASHRAVNHAGETPLMRASMFHNSYTKRTYPRIFQLLQDTVFDIDSQSQTVVHHIVKRRSNTQSALYYLDVLLSKIKDFSPQYRIETLINTQDDKGNTPLHIAAINGDKKFFQTLLGSGALSTLKNYDGVTADVFINNKFSRTLNYSEHSYHYGNGTTHSPASTSTGAVITGPAGAAAASASASFIHTGDMFPSQAATSVSRAIPEVINLMKDMADSYQGLYQDRSQELQSIKKMLKSMNNTVASVDIKILETLDIKKYEQIGQTMEDITQAIDELQSRFTVKQKCLMNILEKGQRIQLQRLINEQEQEIDKHQEESESKSGPSINPNLITGIKELAILQLRRKAKIKQMLELLCGNSKVQKFRKMISQGTDMELDEVDNFLDVILQQLNDDNEAKKINNPNGVT